MKTFGSYRKLLENSKQAMLAAIEIYNKPKFDYREEVFVILLVNAWELILLAILSKKKQRIFQPKEPNKDYQTLNFSDSINNTKDYFPAGMGYEVVVKNLDSLRNYRNKAVHYYNTKETAHCVYVLAQAAIRNYRDLVKVVFEQDIVNQINLVLLPLSFNEQPDFIEFFKNVKPKNRSTFAQELFSILENFESEQLDTSRFITQCKVKLESVKKIQSADFTVAVDNSGKTGNVVITKAINLDDSHPFFKKDIIGNKKTKKHDGLNVDITQYQFDAILWKNKLKTNDKYCWASKKGGSPRYSQHIIQFFNSLSEKAIEEATLEYKEHNNKQNKKFSKM